MRWLVYMVWIIGFVPLVGQQTANPFEIKNRLDTTVRSTDNNPFEVISRQDTIRQLPTSISNDSISFLNPSTDNPFEVDHTPIRKSTLKEESALRTKERKERANKIIAQANDGGPGLLVFFVALVSMLLIAIVANTRRSLFGKISRSFFNDNYLKLTQREENSGMNGAFIILYIVFILNAGIFIYLLVRNFLPGNSLPWFLCILVVLLIYLGRHIFLYLFGQVFPVTREANQYNFVIATFNLLIGLLLVPINLIIAYTTPTIGIFAIYASLGILAFIFFVRSAKGFLLGLIASGGALFHFLLYLCTFEIVPVLVLIKLIQHSGDYF